MTFKATLLSTSELKLAGLVEHQLLTPLLEKDRKRWLFVTQDVEDLLTGKKNPAAMFPSASADIAIGRFCKGFIVSFTRKTTGKADFKGLKDHTEAWSLTLPGPGSGWRMFGRFARKNVFVGLSCYERGECAPFAKYNQRAVDMIADWQSRFATDPLRATDYADYVGEMYIDKDN